MRATLSLLATGALTLAACDDAEDPGAGSSFSGNVTGAYEQGVAGEARHGVVRDGGTTGYSFVLGDGGPARIVLQWPSLVRPSGTGAYEIVPKSEPEPDGKFSGRVLFTVNGALEIYEVRSGQLLLTANGGDGIEGTVELRAVRTSPCCDTQPVQLFVTGAFLAKPVN
jgi:hypothetical protein